MKDLGIHKAFLPEIDDELVAFTNHLPITELFDDYLLKLNTPFYDLCCPTINRGIFPVGFKDNIVKRYDGENWVPAQVAETVMPDDLYFVVPTSGSPYINDGGQVITLPVEFLGFKTRVIRNNVPLDYLDQGTNSPYFEIDTVNNFINLSADVIEGDKFMIQAYKLA